MEKGHSVGPWRLHRQSATRNGRPESWYRVGTKLASGSWKLSTSAERSPQERRHVVAQREAVRKDIHRVSPPTQRWNVKQFSRRAGVHSSPQGLRGGGVPLDVHRHAQGCGTQTVAPADAGPMQSAGSC